MKSFSLFTSTAVHISMRKATQLKIELHTGIHTHVYLSDICVKNYLYNNQ